MLKRPIVYYFYYTKKDVKGHFVSDSELSKEVCNLLGLSLVKIKANNMGRY